MKSIFFITFLFVLLSCKRDTLSIETIAPAYSKTFINDSPRQKTNNTLILTRIGDKVIAERTEQKLIGGTTPTNAFFIETDNLINDSNGFIKVKKRENHVWFVPFFVGSKPVDIDDPVRCFKYYCNCGGTPGGQSPSGCIVFYYSSEIRCESLTDWSCPVEGQYCTGSAAWVDCNTEAPVDFFTGGVFIEAGEVIIKDPEYFKPNPEGVLDLIQTDDGQIMIKSAYEKSKSRKQF